AKLDDSGYPSEA
nr:type I DNA methyltransferase M.EcoR124 I chain HsdM - Escherichia coli (fragments) [Escherichia coli]